MTFVTWLFNNLMPLLLYGGIVGAVLLLLLWIDHLVADPDSPDQTAGSERDQFADELSREADELEAQELDDEHVAPESAATAEARQLIAEAEQSLAGAQSFTGEEQSSHASKQARANARGLLSAAERLLQTGEFDAARILLEEVLERYPKVFLGRTESAGARARTLVTRLESRVASQASRKDGTDQPAS
jgi:hypothetical protein